MTAEEVIERIETLINKDIAFDGVAELIRQYGESIREECAKEAESGNEPDRLTIASLIRSIEIR